MLKWLANSLLALCGWKMDNAAPDLPKYVVLAVPHTALSDGFYMVCMNYSCDLRGRWLVKDSAYRFPFRRMFDALGAVPVDRSQSHNLVEHVAQEFATNERFHLVIAPEGTRSYRDFWKSGFYHIALQAKIPVVLSYLDYSRKRGGFGPVIHLTGNMRADMDQIRAFYKASWAKFPDLMAPIRLRDEEASDTLPHDETFAGHRVDASRLDSAASG